MQERITQCLIDDSNISEAEATLEDNMDVLIPTDVEDVAEMVSGYAECMAEAVRYLTQVENYPLHHPAVRALQCHLADYRRKLLQTALYNSRYSF
uniref:Orange domain-containing protein n=1 Tax=Panstrongylus megistus TaxID=65343 RepID=A0A069DN65_9HEMI